MSSLPDCSKAPRGPSPWACRRSTDRATSIHSHLSQLKWLEKSKEKKCFGKCMRSAGCAKLFTKRKLFAFFFASRFDLRLTTDNIPLTGFEPLEEAQRLPNGHHDHQLSSLACSTTKDSAKTTSTS